MKNHLGGDSSKPEKREEMTARQAFERVNSLIGSDMIRTLIDDRNIEYKNLTNIESDRDTSDENGRVIQQYRFTFMNGDMPSLTPNEEVTFIFNRNNSINNDMVDRRRETNDNNTSLQLAGRRKRKTHRRKTHNKRKTHKRKSHRRRGSRRK